MPEIGLFVTTKKKYTCASFLYIQGCCNGCVIGHTSRDTPLNHLHFEIVVWLWETKPTSTLSLKRPILLNVRLARLSFLQHLVIGSLKRSEERREGKECRS